MKRPPLISYLLVSDSRRSWNYLHYSERASSATDFSFTNCKRTSTIGTVPRVICYTLLQIVHLGSLDSSSLHFYVTYGALIAGPTIGATSSIVTLTASTQDPFAARAKSVLTDSVDLLITDHAFQIRPPILLSPVFYQLYLTSCLKANL